MFDSELAQIFNSGAAKSVILYGNIYDLFKRKDWLPLVPFLRDRFQSKNWIQVVYELNGPVLMDSPDKVRDAWIKWKTGYDANDLAIQEMTKRGASRKEAIEKKFDEHVEDAIGKPSAALEFMRQLTMVSRSNCLKENLFIIIEGADMAMPMVELSRMSPAQYRRIAIVQDWFCDPEFTSGDDCVCLLAESPSMIHERVSKLPQVMGVEVSSPDHDTRLEYTADHLRQANEKVLTKVETTGDCRHGITMPVNEIASLTAGLSIQALRQLLSHAVYKRSLNRQDIVAKVESFIQSQVGEDVVEFNKPEHRLEDVIGNTELKEFLKLELIPRFKKGGKQALSGAAVGGPIGAGKTFIFEAVAAELGVPVLVLKNLRSQWYGQTDVIFERLRRTLEALGMVMIIVDEADTQFGSVSQESHSTERRLTGKIQQMQSDPKLRGKVVWLLMTARLHLLSPDIRRPGRVGDLIIPVLDPEGEDRKAFVTWMLAYPFTHGEWFNQLEKVRTEEEAQVLLKQIEQFKIEIDGMLPKNASAALFASLKSYIEAMELVDPNKVKEAISDHIPPDIDDTRRYQELQALVNCTRKSLLPAAARVDLESSRNSWHHRIKELEAEGIG